VSYFLTVGIAWPLGEPSGHPLQLGHVGTVGTRTVAPRAVN
jgi:hypothetical protein